MYSFAYDSAAVALVGIFSLEVSTDDDYARDQAAGWQLLSDAAHRKKMAVWIVVNDPGHRRPNAAQRRIIAAGREAARTQGPLCLAIVSTSPLIRGLLNALTWIAPITADQVTAIVPTFDHALLWAEQQRGEMLPVLRKLLATARRHASEPSGSTTRGMGS
jgi:hypothetical protein